MIFNNKRTFISCLIGGVSLMGLAACSVKIDAPDRPIILQIDLNIKHELELKVERDLEKASSTPRVPLAKKAGWIGERADGYVGVVRKDAPQEIRDMVIEVNEARLIKYDEIAVKHGIETSTVEKVAGSRLIKKSPNGEYISLDSETWVRK